MRQNGGFKLNLNLKALRTQRTEIADDDEDRTPLADRVPFLWWSVGLVCSVIMSCAILATKFHMNVGEAILALLLGFIFSFIGVQSTGATDINPVSTVAKVCSSPPFSIKVRITNILISRPLSLSSVVLERALVWQ